MVAVFVLSTGLTFPYLRLDVPELALLPDPIVSLIVGWV